jgi:endoglucanase
MFCNDRSACSSFERLIRTIHGIGPKWATLLGLVIALASFHLSARETSRNPEAAAVCAAIRSGGVPGARLAWLARGFNLTGWVDRDEPRRPDLGLLSRLRGLGFNHVRLPVYGEALMAAFSDRETIAERLRQVDLGVDLLLTLDYAVIVDMHPGGRFKALHTADPDRAFEQLEAAWRALAQRLSGRDPDRVFFELLNEPTVSQSVWDAQAARLAASIRKLAPDHTLILGPTGAQDVAALRATEPLDVPNAVYAIHFYSPMEFTHQGLDWAGETPLAELRGVPYPLAKDDPKVQALLAGLSPEAAARLRAAIEENWDDARIAASLAPAAAWALSHNKPIIVDEFGVLGRYASLADRARWLGAVRTEAERFCFGWTHWEFDEAFGLLDAAGQTVEPALAKALLGK